MTTIDDKLNYLVENGGGSGALSPIYFTFRECPYSGTAGFGVRKTSLTVKGFKLLKIRYTLNTGTRRSGWIMVDAGGNTIVNTITEDTDIDLTQYPLAEKIIFFLESNNANQIEGNVSLS